MPVEVFNINTLIKNQLQSINFQVLNRSFFGDTGLSIIECLADVSLKWCSCLWFCIHVI